MPYKDKVKEKENRRIAYLRHKEKIQIHNQKPEIKQRRALLRKDYYQNKKEYFRAYQLKKKYNLEYVDYLLLLEMCNGICPICGCKMQSIKKAKDCIVVDHCHNTSKVRGLLCSNCNRGLGFLDTPEKLEKALIYLKKHD